MAKVSVYASTGAFITRKNNRNFRLIKEIAPKLKADGLEFMMYDSWDGQEKEIARELTDAHLFIPVMHLDKSIGDCLAEGTSDGQAAALVRFQRDLRTALTLGAEKMVLHLWNGPASDAHFDESLPILEKMHRLSEKAGVMLTTENVICKNNPALLRLKQIAEYLPGAMFTYDTKMGHLWGENDMLQTGEWKWLAESGAIRHLHLNDSAKNAHSGGRMAVLHPGDGEVDFNGLIAFFKRSFMPDSATCESTSCRDDGTADIDKMNKSLSFIRKSLEN